MYVTRETICHFILQHPPVAVLFLVFSPPDFIKNDSTGPVSFLHLIFPEFLICLPTQMTKSVLTKILETYSNDF